MGIHRSETLTRGHRPCAEYKAIETTVILNGKSYRAIVVHSSSHDKRRQRKVETLTTRSTKEITTKLKKIPTVYACEADAIAAAKQVNKEATKLHCIHATITPVSTRKRGRPPADQPTPTTTRYHLIWELIENSSEIAQLKKIAGCFVLITSVPKEGDAAMDSTSILRTYKGQCGVESDFSFLKDPIIVNDIFLKTPSRIDALGMVLIIALMIWRLMERSMRAHIENTGQCLQGWAGRDTYKPTAFMMSTAMVGIMVALLNGQRYLLCPPKTRPMAFLIALGLNENAFTDSHFKCRPVIPQKSG
jgi:transposase